jgi:maltose O-acetyltransferase
MNADVLRVLATKVRRDHHLPLGMRVHKGTRYLKELFTAPLWLWGADTVGPHARTSGRPRIENFGRLEIGANVLIRSMVVPVELCVGPGGVLRIGDDVLLNYGTSVAVESQVTIGNRVLVGTYVMIVDNDFHDPHHRSRHPAGSPIVIEDDAWIGSKASVLKGVRIGRGAIVGAGAVVTRDVEALAIVAGVPARRVGKLDPSQFEPEAMS